MKRVMWVLMLGMLLLTSCGLFGGPSIDKANDLLNKGKYDEAILMFEALIDENEEDYEAWLDMIRAQYDEKDYRDADRSMERMLKVIEKNYDTDSETIDYEDVVRLFMRQADRLLNRAETIGDWYARLQLPYLDLYEYGWRNYEPGELVSVTLPEGISLYYRFESDYSDKKVSARDTRYRDGFEMPDALGEYVLFFAPVNALGVIGDTDYIYVTVAEMMAAPKVSVEPGTYDGPLHIEILDFDPDGAYYYTLDGTDPELNGSYVWDNTIVIEGGEVELRLIAYDYDNYQYSKAFSGQYTVINKLAISNPTKLTVGIIGVYPDIYSDLSWIMGDIGYYVNNMEVELVEISSIDQLVTLYASGSAPDVLYTWGGFLSHFGEASLPMSSILADISVILDLNQYDYFDGVLKSGNYKNVQYLAPVTVAPSALLYADYYSFYDTSLYTNLSFEGFIEAFDMESYYTEDNFAMDYFDIHNVLSIYLGYGGQLVNNNGTFTLENEPLEATLTYLHDLIHVYGATEKSLNTTQLLDMKNYGESVFFYGDFMNYNSYDFNYIYEGAGNMPLPGGATTKPLLWTNGLIVGAHVIGDLDKEAAVRNLYEFLATDRNYYYYYASIANSSNGLPAIKSLVDENYYSYMMPVDTFVQVIESGVALEPELEAYIIAKGYRLRDVITAVVAQGMTPSQGVEQILALFQE